MEVMVVMVMVVDNDMVTSDHCSSSSLPAARVATAPPGDTTDDIC